MAVLLFHVLAGLSGLHLAVLGVAVLPSLLGTGLHLELASLLWLEMVVLLHILEREGIGELLAVPVHVSLESLYLVLLGESTPGFLSIGISAQWMLIGCSFMMSISDSMRRRTRRRIVRPI